MNPALMLEAAQQYCNLHKLKFLGHLGQGAFKCAFLIEFKGMQGALKIAELSTGSEERLMRETSAIRSCDHVSIAKTFNAERFVHHGTQYWVVIEEFLSGGSLEKKLNEKNIAISSIRQLGISLAVAISHLHEKKLVHRDVKPANILFRDDGLLPVLTDFGIVRILDSPSLTQDFLGQGPGTPFYAAPEQLNNDKALIDWRTDQFGLAIVLSHCLLGHHPFQEVGASTRDAILNVAARGALPKHNLNLLAEHGFDVLIRAMSVWPISRYRKPTDLISALMQ